MEHSRLVYELRRDARRVYCSSFAVVIALVDMGWTLSAWGEWDQLRRRDGDKPIDATGDSGGGLR